MSALSVMLYPCVFYVALSMDLLVMCVACLTVFVNCLVKQFAICLDVVFILLLNVMVMFIVVRGALLDIPCMVFERVCCAGDSIMSLDAHSICLFVFCVCRKFVV